MATRFVHQGLDLEQSPYSDVAPFAVDQNGSLAVRRGAAWKGVASTDPGKEPISVNRVVVLGATTTLTTASACDNGALIVANTTVTVTLQLPAAANNTGFTIGLSVGKLTSSGGHKITPVAADTINFTSAAAGSSLECSAASDVLGDVCWLRADGGTTWYIVGKVGTWAAV